MPVDPCYSAEFDGTEPLKLMEVQESYPVTVDEESDAPDVSAPSFSNYRKLVGGILLAGLVLSAVCAIANHGQLMEDSTQIDITKFDVEKLYGYVQSQPRSYGGARRTSQSSQWNPYDDSWACDMYFTSIHFKAGKIVCACAAYGAHKKGGKDGGSLYKTNLHYLMGCFQHTVTQGHRNHESTRDIIYKLNHRCLDPVGCRD